MSSKVPLIPAIEEKIRNLVRGDVPWSLRYLNEFFALKCAPDIFYMFPNPKEVTESFGAFNAVKKHLKDFDPKDPRVGLIAVGDGATPRTASTFAFRTQWDCLSIDPLLRTADCNTNFNRISYLPCKIEHSPSDVSKWICRSGCSKLIIACVHSHANLENVLRIVKSSGDVVERIAIVAIQCCVPQVLKNKEPDLEYRDWSILSPENLVKVWKSV